MSDMSAEMSNHFFYQTRRNVMRLPWCADRPASVNQSIVYFIKKFNRYSKMHSITA